MILRRFILTGIVAAWFAAGSVAEARAQSLSPQEYENQVKATFIYNFSRFIEWPAETFTRGKSSLTICVLGNNPFGGALDSIEGKNVQGRKIEIERLAGLSKLDACKILFVSSSEREHLKEILESAKHSRILTISEINQFTQAGGVVALAMRKDRIHFSVNLDAANETGVKISSTVLRLATIVNYAHQGEGR
ncbi:MAG TPA: YfiR family protein [Terriglobia bacterium]|nr:YfiR family protein [Terriglobia bacterium]